MTRIASPRLPLRDAPQAYGLVTRALRWLTAALILWQFLRILWALANRHNRPGRGNGPLGLAARAGHGLLYLVMGTVPALGLLRAWGGERTFAPFGIPVFPGCETPIAWTQSLADALHGELAWFLGLMILGPVVMVGLHEGCGTTAHWRGWRGGGVGPDRGGRAGEPRPWRPGDSRCPIPSRSIFLPGRRRRSCAGGGW